MIGVIAGDIIGSTYQVLNVKDKNFTLYRQLSRYTDNTVLTIATADCVLNDGDFSEYYKKYFRENPLRGYGAKFTIWALQDKKNPYNKMDGRSATRVSPIGYIARSLDDVRRLAEKSTIVTHSHPEEIKSSQAIAMAIFLSLYDCSKDEIRKLIEYEFHYDLSMSYDELKKSYKCKGTSSLIVPQAIISFLDSTNYEEAIRNAICIGGDSNTLACITGGIAEAYYKDIPKNILDNTIKRLKPNFADIMGRFSKKFILV